MQPQDALTTWHLSEKGSGTFAGTARRVLRTKVPDPFSDRHLYPKRGQAPLPERPEGCCAQRCLTPFRIGAWRSSGWRNGGLTNRRLAGIARCISAIHPSLWNKVGKRSPPP